MTHPPLPDEVVVLPGIDVEALWESTEVFEALHHQMDIMDPLSSDDLDAVLDLLAPVDGDRMLDIGCGHGEMLLRAARRAAIKGVGIDLSPWQIRRCALRATAAGLGDRLSWRFGRGEDTPPEPVWDVVTSLGMSWVWSGFVGTVEALMKWTRPGGRIAIGDLQLRPGGDRAALADYPGLLDRTEQVAALASLGVKSVAEVIPEADGWDAYHDRTRESALAWRELHPGPRADEHMGLHRQWVDQHDAERDHITWTVWVGRMG